MKKMILLIIAFITTGNLMAANMALVPNDTIITLNGKIIEMTENEGRTKVKIYKENSNNNKELIYESHYRDAQDDEDRVHVTLNKGLAAGDTVINVGKMSLIFMEHDGLVNVKLCSRTDDGECIGKVLIFEGRYRNGQSYESRRYVKSLIRKITNRDKGFDPHWGGFGMGFANFMGSSGINDVDGVSLKSGNSLEYNLNFLEHSWTFSRYHWAVISGFGLRWDRYRLDMNKYFQEVNGVTVLVPAPEGIVYKKSKLNTTSLVIPLLLEWQSSSCHGSCLFVSAGMEGVVKTASSSRVVYNDLDGKEQKRKVDGGMTLRPVTMDFIMQAGIGNFGAYAKYSPMGLFENNKGPKLHPVSIGLFWHIF